MQYFRLKDTYSGNGRRQQNWLVPRDSFPLPLQLLSLPLKGKSALRSKGDDDYDDDGFRTNTYSVCAAKAEKV